MVASVPELTMRSISIDGTRRVMASAMLTSAGHGVPNDSPSWIARCTASRTCAWSWPAIIGPQEPT